MSDVLMSALCQKQTLCSAATDRGMYVEFSPVGGEGCKAPKGPNTSNCSIWLAWVGRNHLPGARVDKGTYLPRCAAVQRPGSFRIIAVMGFDPRDVQSSLQSPFTKQNGERR
jgi:hypothetical protein